MSTPLTQDCAFPTTLVKKTSKKKNIASIDNRQSPKSPTTHKPVLFSSSAFRALKVGRKESIAHSIQNPLK